MRTLLAATAVLSLAYATLAQPGGLPAPMGGTTGFPQGPMPGGGPPPGPGGPGFPPGLSGLPPMPGGVPGDLPPGSAFDQALNELKQIRAQKAELVKREEAVTQQLRKLLEQIQKDAGTVGIEAKDPRLKIGVPPNAIIPGEANEPARVVPPGQPK